MHNSLIQLIILTASSIVFVPLFKWFKMGPILAYLFAGVVIGPHLLGFIQSPEIILSFSELGVIFLLFIIGLELAPKRLWELRGHIFGMGLLQFLVTGILLSLIGYSLGLPIPVAYISGFGLSLSSTAFGIQILEEKRQLKTTHGQGSFAILMFQDLAVVPLMLSLSLFSGNATSNTLAWFPILKGVTVLTLLIGIGPKVVRWGLRLIADTRLHEIFIATTLFIVIGTGLLFEHIGFSLGMGAFIAGVLLANSEYKHELETNLKPFKSLLLGLFFIAVGMSLNLGIVVSRPHIVLLLTIGLIVIKFLVVYLLGRVFKFAPESSRNMAFTLLQGGEFGFVLFSLALKQELLNSEIVSILNAAIILSMALTPILFSLNEKLFRRSNELSERPFDDINAEETEVIVAGYGRFGQIICRFLNTQKVKFIVVDHNPYQVDMARKYNQKIFYGDASRLGILDSVGAKNAKFFVLAINDVEQSVKIAKLIKKDFPHLRILARARNRKHVFELLKLGQSENFRETLLSSLEVAKSIMLQKGVNTDVLNEKVSQFIKKDQEILNKQFGLKENEEGWISFAHETDSELETTFMFDQ